MYSEPAERHQSGTLSLSKGIDKDIWVEFYQVHFNHSDLQSSTSEPDWQRVSEFDIRIRYFKMFKDKICIKHFY